MNVLSVILQRTKLTEILKIRRSLPLVPHSMSLTYYCIIFSVFDVKRLIGRKFDDTIVQSDRKYFPFKVFDKGGKPYIGVEHRGEEKELVCINFIAIKTIQKL